MKKLTAALTAMMLLLSLASCSLKKSDEESTVQATSESTTASGAESSTEEIDFSDMVVGKITKISNNQVTLELGEIDPDSLEKPDVSMPDDASLPEGEAPEASDGEKPSMPDSFDAGSIPDDFDPENMPDGMSLPDGFDPDNIPSGAGGFSASITAEVTYTGETARYTIPSEVKIGSGDYTSLSKGDVIALGFDDDGIVNSVMLITEKGTDS